MIKTSNKALILILYGLQRMKVFQRLLEDMLTDKWCLLWKLVNLYQLYFQK
jgi:hypothetical protein